MALRHASSSAYVLDKDGTLVHHDEAIDGARALLQRFEDEGTPYVVLSNTGEKSAAQVAAALSATIGAPIAEARVRTARQALEEVLARTDAFDVVRVVGVPPPGYAPFDAREAPPADATRACVALFSDGAIDDYAATATAVGTWLAAGAQLWATSADGSVAARDPRTKAIVRRPGPGAFLGVVRAVAEDAQIVVFGKESDPSAGTATMAKLRAQGFKGAPRDVMMVGDRFDTDVRAGVRHGWSTCLVESGCHTEAHAALFPSDVASRVAASVAELARQRDPTLAETVGDLVRETLRQVPRSSHVAEWIGTRLRRAGRAIDDALLIGDRPPRRIRSLPDLQRA
jgi:ribonucleotide monophosphatase NagD (HAD superfamily)